MADTSLDSLSIVLRASAKDATDAIDAIIKSLGKLNDALYNFRADSPYMKGLNNLASGLKSVRISLNGLDAKNIQDVSKALDKLASAGERLSSLTGIMPAGTASQMTQIVSASDKAIKMAEDLGKKLHFDKERDGVERLAEGIEKLSASMGDDSAVRSAMENIDSILEKYGRWKDELQDFHKAQLEVVRTANIKLGHGAQEALGGDYETARRNRGSMGIANTSKHGTSVSAIVDENAILGIEKEANEIDQLNQVMERTKEAAEGAKREFVSFHEADVTLTGGLEGLQAETNAIAESLGIVASKAREAEDVLDDDFMSIDTSDVDIWDDPVESIQKLRDTAQETVPAVEALSQAENHLTENVDQMAQVGNIFQGISTGLESLQNVTLSDSLKNLEYVKSAISKFGNEAAGRAAANIQNIGSALNNFSFEMPRNWSDLVALSKTLDRFGTKSQAKANFNILAIRNALDRFRGLTIDPNLTTSIKQLGDGLYRFGLAKMDKAVNNIPQLAGGMTQLITSLANAPQVSENTIRLVTALGNMNVRTGDLTRNVGGVNRGLKSYRSHALNAQKASQSLASAFGKMYANFFIFFRLINRFKKDIDLASQLTEVQNVVDVTFAQAADKMNDFAKSAIDSLGMSELTAKQVGSRFQAMGKAMTITPVMVKGTNEFVQTATNGYANVANSMADVSINLTRLAGDMASFYNADYAEVAKDLESVMTGLTKPLRKYGLDLTVATLEEWAMRNGMEANMKTMTQAEKTLLRYQYVMANTTAAHGDFIRTQSTWANQIRLATEKLNQLRIVLGKIAIYTFKPLVQNFNKAMEQILKGAEGLLNSLGKIFGWQIEWSDVGVLGDEADDAEELADNMGDAADNAKKFKNFLLGIDELNLLPDNSDKDKGAGAGLGDLSGNLEELGKFNIKPVERQFDSLYDTLFKLGNRINEIIGDLLDGINWDAVYAKARRFGGGLGDFINGLLANSETFYKIGRFFANGINTIAHALDEFHQRIDGFQLGVDIGSLVNGFIDSLDWRTIQHAAVGKAHDLAQAINGAFITIKWKDVGRTIAEGLNTAIDYFYTLGKEIKWSVIGASIATGINGFFANFDFAQAADTLNLWAKGLLDALIKALDKTDWEMVGEKIGEFISRIDVMSIAGKVAKALWKALNGAFSAWGGLLETAPLETALGTALIIPFSNRYFRSNISGHIMDFAKLVGTSLSKDLTKVFNGSVFRNFGRAFMAAPIVDNNTLGTMFNGLTAGFNSFSASLTTATKAIGGIGVGLGEFFLIKDAITDIVVGTDDLGASITKLSATVGVAGVAFSALLGVPTGLIITGAVAGAAAIAGISKAIDQISDNNIISTLSRDMGDASITLDGIAKNFKVTADEITGGVDKMNAQHDKLSSMKSDLSGMIGGLGLIKTAAEEGASLTAGALQELVGNIGEVKNAWEEYIKAQYDYMIQSTVNNMNFIKSQRDLTDEETEYFTNKINELTEAKYNDIRKTTSAASEAEDAWGKYFDALNNVTVDRNGQKVYTESLYDLKQAALDATNELYSIGEATGVINSDEVKELNGEVAKLNKEANDFVLSLSNIDGSDLSSYSTALSGFGTQMQETFDNATAKIDEYKENLKLTMPADEVEKEVQEYYNALNRAMASNVEIAQSGLYDQFYKILASGDRTTAAKYADEIIKPFVEAFPTVIDEEGRVVKPWIADSVNKMIDADSWDWSGMFPKLRKNWQNMFYQAAPDTYKNAKGFGSKIAEAMADGLTDGSKKMTNATEETAKTSAAAYGNISRDMVDVRDKAGLAFSGVADVNRVLNETGKSGEGIKTISDSFTGLNTMLSTFGISLAPIKTGFVEFTEQTKTNMIATSAIFGQSFDKIKTYGNQTLSWFKSSFVPMFSGAYWQSLTASIPNAFGNAFKQATNIMVNIWKQFAQWANANMKINVNANGKKQSEIKVDVPTYSTGGFPEDGFFYANHSEMVGSFNNGKTAVANNAQIVEGIKQGVYEAMMAANGNGGSNVTVELRGDASDIFTAVVKENNRAIYRTGSSPIRN